MTMIKCNSAMTDEAWSCISCLDASIIQPYVRVTSEKSSKAILNASPNILNQSEVEGPGQKYVKQYNLKFSFIFIQFYYTS